MPYYSFPDQEFYEDDEETEDEEDEIGSTQVISDELRVNVHKAFEVLWELGIKPEAIGSEQFTANELEPKARQAFEVLHEFYTQIGPQNEEVEYEYEYEAIEPSQFTPNDLEPKAHRAFEALRELGIQAVYCSYNGGNDEGFANFDAVELESRRVELHELMHRLAGNLLGNKPFSDKATQRQFRSNLDLFADALAMRLLGSGYGTGEYSLRGSFRADLMTGIIIDQQEQ
jgi:hypothetical protein